ncbi:hypothetical protein [uncultured Aquabacterium sp.]|uniref:hypothetical protein n=1 Tax=uncultured Aquabacterium sp. TaxID=158753 RepID=UPI0025D278B7|nr:hypothetical protein [uncultured Aquabacterium sp.]
MLRPLPDLQDADNMARLGRLSAIRSARLDALHDMRDAVVRLQNGSSIDSVELKVVRDCVERLEQLEQLSKAAA